MAELNSRQQALLDSAQSATTNEIDVNAQARARIMRQGASPDDAAKETPQAVVTDTTTPPSLHPWNRLHDFATYTYGLTLYMLHKNEFEELQSTDAEKVAAWYPKHALISSAGRFNKPYADNADGSPGPAGRQSQFSDDFYFDNFRMNTVVGLNSQTRGTNAIEFSFTIIEPYGLSLLDRLIAAANGEAVGSQNYLAQPYLLELDFFGSTDLGNPTTPIPELRKRFPISIIEFKIRASSKGSEYAIKAVPFNHKALQENIVATPVNLEISATTIGDFFNAVQAQEVSNAVKEREETAARKKEEASASLSEARNDTQIEARTATLNSVKLDMTTPFQVNSYTDAINDWHQYNLDKNNISAKDTISFQFDPVFLVGDGAKINPPTTPDLQRAGSNNDKAKVLGNDTDQNSKTATALSNVYKFNINAGQSIIDVINMVMRNSNYIKNQFISPTDSRFKEDTVINFYKIIPQIRKLDYDEIRKRYAYDIVYHVVPYSYYNAKNPNVPYSFPKYAVKEYNYMYSGKNIDILDFNIEFNVAFYNGIVALPAAVDTGNNKVEADAIQEPDAIKKADPMAPNPSAINQIPSDIWSQNAPAGAVGVKTGEQHFIASAITSIYSNAKGDMIEVKLKIIGDPDFIKQDDIYTSPGMPNYKIMPVGPDGQIAYDHSDVFCRINFMSPTDMDESTGLLRKDTDYARSKFSGFYKIITVDNEFAKGQFVQTLTCVRMLEATPAKEKAVSLGKDAQTTQDNLDAIRKSEQAMGQQDNDSRLADMETSRLAAKYPVPHNNVQMIRAIDNKVADQYATKLQSANTYFAGGKDSSVVSNPEVTDVQLAMARNLNASIKKSVAPRRGGGSN